MIDPIRTPAATYRLQLRRECSLGDAAAAVPYLRLLGVSDLYLSPLHTARSGSIHGYDVVDHQHLNPELGDTAALRQLFDVAQAADLGVIVDVVPNHMCIASDANHAWMEVLDEGRESPSAATFDIDWEPPKPELVGKVLLPFLSTQYGRVLEEALSIHFEAGRFFALCNQQRLPIRPETWRHVIEPVLALLRQRLPPEDTGVIECESILRALAQTLPPLGAAGSTQAVAYRHEKEAIRMRLALLADGRPAVGAGIAESLRAINGTPGDPSSFDQLERLMDQQVYRLADWRVAAHEVNYRRFFDINELAAVRVEEPEVFAKVHAIPFACAGHPAFTGLRVDHVDGLSDPEDYLTQLGAKWNEARSANGGGNARPFVVVEKILGSNERLPAAWLADGTTGYDFIPILSDVLFWSPGSERLHATAALFCDRPQRLSEIVHESKRLVLRTTLAAELTVLARSLDRISEQHRYSRDFTLNHLQEALEEIIACFPVYRTYMRRQDTAVAERDATVIGTAIARARRRSPLINVSLFDFVEMILLRVDPSGLSPQQIDERRNFVLRFQQLTGPVAAKGVEDTAFYRYLPLIALNEVGSDPERMGAPASAVHQTLALRHERSPRTLSASRTHDTKRGEDTRARLYVLSEVAEQWAAATAEWSRLTAPHKTTIDGAASPDTAEEYLLYQTLVGAWPLHGLANEPDFPARIRAFMTKARHEAKVHTSWINPHVAYDAAADSFVEAVLDPKRSAAFLESVETFVGTIVRPGLWNSLAQVVLKTAAPGIPDVFQGTELWDFSLVDPDNRRLVDFVRLRGELTGMLAQVEARGVTPIGEWFDAPEDGRIKLWTTAAALGLRRARRRLFDRGAYLPLRPSGPLAGHAFGFARVDGDDAVVALVGRGFATLGVARPTGDAWGETAVVLPPALSGRRFRDGLTRRTFAAEGDSLRFAEVFACLPVALLETIQ